MAKHTHKLRRSAIFLAVLIGVVWGIVTSADSYETTIPEPSISTHKDVGGDVAAALDTLSVKGRAPKTDYSRSQFGDGWVSEDGCDTRNIILKRDLTHTTTNEKCQILTGILEDPYTGKTIHFARGELSSQLVQIDHVVALSDAWQTGAQAMTHERRVALANDPLELLAVDGTANQQKSDSDAATWLPSNKGFRCQYVARQVAVKKKYDLWVTAAEKEAILQILTNCPTQALPTR